MIPRTIHYVWLGGCPLSEEVINCINSWKKYCSEYQIIEWNESNFDLSECEYIEEAYKSQKWAFVSDYIRMAVLYRYGGIYLDTDVEILQPLDKFLVHRAFLGFETDSSITTGIMGCEEGHPFFKEMMEQYYKIHFIRNDGTLDMTTNVKRVTRACEKKGVILDNSRQELLEIAFYPQEFFSPLSHNTGELTITSNTHTIHWFAATWKSEEEREIHNKAIRFKQKHKGKLGSIIGQVYELIMKVRYIIKREGLKELKNRVKSYIKKNRNR